MTTSFSPERSFNPGQSGSDGSLSRHGASFPMSSFGQRGDDPSKPRGSFPHVSSSNVMPQSSVYQMQNTGSAYQMQNTGSVNQMHNTGSVNQMQNSSVNQMQSNGNFPYGNDPSHFASTANGGRRIEEREVMASNTFDNVKMQTPNQTSTDLIPMSDPHSWNGWKDLLSTGDGEEEEENENAEMAAVTSKYEIAFEHLRKCSSAIEVCCNRTAEFTSFHLSRLSNYSVNKLRTIEFSANTVYDSIRENFDAYKRQCKAIKEAEKLPSGHPERNIAQRLCLAFLEECRAYRDLSLLSREVERHSEELHSLMQAIRETIMKKKEEARAANEPIHILNALSLLDERSQLGTGIPATSLSRSSGFNANLQHHGYSGNAGVPQEQRPQTAIPRNMWSRQPAPPLPPVVAAHNVAYNYRLPELPPMTLPTFDGNLKEYDEFVSAFADAVDRRSDLSELTKILYLKSCLRGEALMVLDGISWTGENYDLAKRELNRRFKGSNMLLPSLHRELEAMPKGQVHVNEQLRSLYKIRAIVRRMADYSDVRFQPLLHEKILARFSADTLEKVFKWQHEHRDFSGNLLMPNTEQLLTKVEEVLRCEEFSQSQLASLNVWQSELQQQQNFGDNYTQAESQHRENNEFRQYNHERPQNSHSQRTNEGQRAGHNEFRQSGGNGRPQNSYHQKTNYSQDGRNRSQFQPRKDMNPTGNHSRRESVNTAQEAEKKSEDSIAISVPTVLFTDKNHKNSSHLLTTNIPVMLRGKQRVRTRAMLDTGATVSLVSKSFVKQHGIRPTGSKKLSILGVGGHSKGEDHYDVVQLFLETVKGEKIKVNALVFDNPIPPVNNPRLSEEDAVFVKEKKIHLSDYPRDNVKPPDLLLSLSATIDILDFQNPICLPSGLRLLSSKFGYVIGSASEKDILNDSVSVNAVNYQKSRRSSKKASFAKNRARENSCYLKGAVSSVSKSSHSPVLHIQHVASGDKHANTANCGCARQSKHPEKPKSSHNRVPFIRPRRFSNSLVPSETVADIPSEKGIHFSSELSEYSFFWSEQNQTECSPSHNKTDKIRKKRSHKVYYGQFKHRRQISEAEHAFLAGGSVTGTYIQ